MTPSRFVRVFAWSLSLAAVTACGSAAVETAQSAQAPLTRAPLATAAPLHGPMRPLADAFADVPLSTTQRQAIERELSDAVTRHQGMHAARTELSALVAQQVEAGRLDRAALSAKIDALAAEHAKIAPADQAALERVHAQLDPSQRAAFVDALGAKLAQGFAGHAGAEHREGAHEHAWRGPEPMRRFADELGLSDEQRAKIHESMRARHPEAAAGPDPAGAEAPSGSPPPHGEHRGHHGRGHHPHDMHARWEKFAAAFKSDHFVMAELEPAGAPHHEPRAMATHMIDMVEAALPTLTPEQRAKAATLLREHGARGDGPEGH